MVWGSPFPSTIAACRDLADGGIVEIPPIFVGGRPLATPPTGGAKRTFPETSYRAPPRIQRHHAPRVKAPSTPPGGWDAVTYASRRRELEEVLAEEQAQRLRYQAREAQ